MQDEFMENESSTTELIIKDWRDYSLDVIIPTYKPDSKFDCLIDRLLKQDEKSDHIFIINTEEEYFNTEKYGNIKELNIIHIKKEEFDHGGTRNYAASLSNADLILFMTQDAVPVDAGLISELKKPFIDGRTAAAYGRQLPAKSAGIIEKYTRTFNYPDEDCVKSKKDLDSLGIKTYFCSNVCAVYRRSVYEELGGFVTKTIFNEDMIMASGIIQNDYQIAYVSRAKVIHSHEYSYWQQFTRNFDLGVSQKQYREIFDSVKSETEGVKLVKDTGRYLIDHNKGYLIPDLVFQSGFKYLGYKAGYHYDKLPKDLIRRFSMNPSYWEDEI